MGPLVRCEYKHMDTDTLSLCPVFKRLGEKGRAIDGRNIFFLFSYFCPNRSVISGTKSIGIDRVTSIEISICNSRPNRN